MVTSLGGVAARCAHPAEMCLLGRDEGELVVLEVGAPGVGVVDVHLELARSSRLTLTNPASPGVAVGPTSKLPTAIVTGLPRNWTS